MPPLVELTGLSRRFPGVVALDGVSLTLQAGEVLGLIGENGAGKSTLMKILGGVLAPDTGTICVGGEPVTIPHPAAAARFGIAFIHQELNVVDNLDVAGNVFLGRELTRGPLRLLDRAAMARAAEPHLRRLGLEIDPATPLRRLSLAQRQLVEIARALSLRARVIIMDEPTSSLTLAETARLLEVVRELKREGVGIIFISHRLAELMEIADRVMGLRDGRPAGELHRDELSHDAMVRLMVGRDLADAPAGAGGARRPGFLRVRGVRSRAFPDQPASFDAAAGEILGLAGLVGAGRSELCEALFGVDGDPGGEVTVDGRRERIRSCRDAIAAGLYLATEDRRRTGLVTDLSIRENITLPWLARHARGGLVRPAAERETAGRQLAALRIRAPTIDTRVRDLSGGNQQKVVLGKWLCREPRVMIFDEPTRGIDVGAKAEIHRLMRELAGRGAVVLMISSDMEEVLHVSDRVLVMHEGRVAGVLERADAGEENVMQLAVGGAVAAARPAMES